MYPLTDLIRIRFAIPNKDCGSVCRPAVFELLFALLSAAHIARASAIDSRSLRPYVGRFKMTSLPGLPAPGGIRERLTLERTCPDRYGAGTLGSRHAREPAAVPAARG